MDKKEGGGEGEMGRGATGKGRLGGATGRGATGRGRWGGGRWGGGNRVGEMGREGKEGGKHTECLGGMRL